MFFVFLEFEFTDGQFQKEEFKVNCIVSWASFKCLKMFFELLKLLL